MAIIAQSHDGTMQIEHKLIAHMYNIKRLGLAQITGIKMCHTHLVKKKIQRDLSSQLKLLTYTAVGLARYGQIKLNK